MTEPNIGVRARLAFAVAARESADYSRGLVGDVGTPMLPGERIRAARRLRVLAMTILDRAVLVELAAGTSWAEVADNLALPEAEVRRRYEEGFMVWSEGEPPIGLNMTLWGDFGTALDPDSDPAGMAAALDLWFGRHSEPWEQATDQPVSRILT